MQLARVGKVDRARALQAARMTGCPLKGVSGLSAVSYTMRRPWSRPMGLKLIARELWYSCTCLAATFIP